MLKMEGMTKEKHDSLKFYNYLCQKIGSEEDVRIRRLTLVIHDIGQQDNTIASGSKGEGLDLKGSDLDLMFIDRHIKVYESETEECFSDSYCVPFIMNTDETQPCFTQLYLETHHQNTLLVFTSRFSNIFQMLEINHLRYVLSSEQYKQYCMSYHFFGNTPTKIHGPCLSSVNDEHDIAYCLKCDAWICQAKPWVRRTRTAWPSPELISKIISCGVLFVPIGCKGSINESIEWRISFSVAEKILIFSFSHTQLLCYAMLKILLKELVEKHEDLKGVLCSYYIKTLMFWVSEETDPYLWRPDNIIPCFMACLKRLLYCVKYSILSHYFIPDNNLFLLRFNSNNKEKIITMLMNFYRQGINCFASSETLQDYKNQLNESTESLISRNSRFVQQIMPTFLTSRTILTSNRVLRLLYNFLHSSRTSISRDLFALQISEASIRIPEGKQYLNSTGNKHRYSSYKHDLSYLVIGLNSDAVSGLLKLASFFYVYKNYEASLTVLRYVLQKFTDEKIDKGVFKCKRTLSHIQKYVLSLMKKEKFHTMIKSLTINPFCFMLDSSIIPQELQVEVIMTRTLLSPLQFAHFLNFLCYYHLHDISSCKQSLQRIEHALWRIKDRSYKYFYPEDVNTIVLRGITHELMGETCFAKQAYQLADKLDVYKMTSAEFRLSTLI